MFLRDFSLHLFPHQDLIHDVNFLLQREILSSADCFAKPFGDWLFIVIVFLDAIVPRSTSASFGKFPIEFLDIPHRGSSLFLILTKHPSSFKENVISHL